VAFLPGHKTASKRNYLALGNQRHQNHGIPRRTHLRGQHNEGDTNHDDHIELRGPNVRHKVTISHCGEGHNHIVGALKEIQMSMTSALKVLDATNAGGDRRYID